MSPGGGGRVPQRSPEQPPGHPTVVVAPADLDDPRVAESGDRLVGSVALKDLGGGHLELKTMRADASLRGTGLGRWLLRFALDQARASGATRVSLETGAADVFAPARTLYRAHGFTECVPFGDYHPDRHSAFLTLEL